MSMVVSGPEYEYSYVFYKRHKTHMNKISGFLSARCRDCKLYVRNPPIMT